MNEQERENGDLKQAVAEPEKYESMMISSAPPDGHSFLRRLLNLTKLAPTTI